MRKATSLLNQLRRASETTQVHMEIVLHLKCPTPIFMNRGSRSIWIPASPGVQDETISFFMASRFEKSEGNAPVKGPSTRSNILSRNEMMTKAIFAGRRFLNLSVPSWRPPPVRALLDTFLAFVQTSQPPV